MTSAVSTPSLGTGSLYADHVQKHIGEYISARDAFNSPDRMRFEWS